MTAPQTTDRLAAFQVARSALVSGYDALLSLAGNPDWAELAPYREMLAQGRSYLEEEIFQVIVFGEFKHGKSTFMNALLRQRVCPMRVTPETAKVSRIHHAPNRPASFRAIGEGLPGDEQPLADLAMLHEYVGQHGKFTSRVREIDIYVDGRGTPLACGAIFVDTPGLRSVFEDHDRITEQYLKKADAVIFFFDGLRPFTVDEQNFLLAHPEVAHGQGTLYVLNRIDQIGGGAGTPGYPEAVREVEAHVRAQLERLGIKLSEDEHGFPRLFPISAYQALEHDDWGARPDPAKYEASRFDTLKGFLGRALADRKGLIIIEGAVKKQAEVLASLERSLGRSQAMIERVEETRREIEARRKTWEAKVVEARKEGRAITNELSAACRDLERDYAQAVEGFAAKLKGAVRTSVRAASSAKQVQAQIPRQISEECSRFSHSQDAALQRQMDQARQRAERRLRQFQVDLEHDLEAAFKLESAEVDTDGISDGVGIPVPAGGAGLAGAGIGFAVGGPVGAAIGAALGGLIGGLLGWFFSKDWRDEACQKLEAQIDSNVVPRLEDGGSRYIQRAEEALVKGATRVVEAVIGSLEQEAHQLVELSRKKAAEIEAEKTALAAKRRALDPVQGAVRTGREFAGTPPVAVPAEPSAGEALEDEELDGEEPEDDAGDVGDAVEVRPGHTPRAAPRIGQAKRTGRPHQRRRGRS